MAGASQVPRQAAITNADLVDVVQAMVGNDHKAHDDDVMREASLGRPEQDSRGTVVPKSTDVRVA